jgi:hypothetical protein
MAPVRVPGRSQEDIGQRTEGCPALPQTAGAPMTSKSQRTEGEKLQVVRVHNRESKMFTGSHNTSISLGPFLRTSMQVFDDG